MKKLLFPIIIAAALAAGACSTDNEPADGKTTGGIRLKPGLDLVTEKGTTRDASPVADLTAFNLTLEGPTAVQPGPCPHDGLVEGLEQGEYTVTLSNMPEEFTPAFGDPRYAGSETVEVVAQQIAATTLVLTQVNAGVKFVYDPSLANMGIADLTPTVTGDDGELTFTPGDETSTGYFTPGGAQITFTIAGQPATVGGEAAYPITLAAKDLLTVTLKIDDSGSLAVSVTFEGPADKDAEVGLDIPTPGIMRVEGLASRTIELGFTDGTAVNVELDEQGYVIADETLESIGNKMVEKLIIDGNEFLIGRTVLRGFHIKLDTEGNLVFRDALEEYVPIGTYCELELVGVTLTGNYRQDADIDLMSKEWTPIGKASPNAARFNGKFDGAGYKIHNLLINQLTHSTDGVALFGYVAGTLENITVASGEVIFSAGTYAASICGIAGYRSVLRNCVNYANVVSNGNYTGGVAARVDGAEVSDCRNYGDVSSNNIVAGVCSYATLESTVTACLNAGNITAYSTCGGIIGRLGHGGVVSGCVNTGSVTSSKEAAGGIVGDMQLNEPASVTACRNTGKITGNSYTAGIVGHIFDLDSNSKTIAMYACCNMATITRSSGSASTFGSILGGSESVGRASLYNCYWSGGYDGTNKVAGSGTVSMIDICYLNDGTTAPDGVVVGWPVDDASKNWGLYAGSTAGGYWWASLGTAGTTDYPTLWWE